MSFWEFFQALRWGLAIGGSLAAAGVMGGGGLRIAIAVPIGIGVSVGVTFAIARLERGLAERSLGAAVFARYGAVLLLDLASGVLAYFVALAALRWLG